MNTALDRSERDRIDHKPGLELGLDREEPTDLPKHQTRANR